MLTTMRARVRRMVFDGIASPTKRRPKNYGGGGAIIGQCAAQVGAFSNRGKAAERTVDVLWNPIGALLKHFSPHNGQIFFCRCRIRVGLTRYSLAGPHFSVPTKRNVSLAGSS